MRKISFINEKGGSCKTTLTINTASYLALKGNKKVLVIDMDPQGHIGKSLGFNCNEIENTISEMLLSNSKNPSEFILKTGIHGLDIIPSNKRLADFQYNFTDLDDLYLLNKKVKDLKGYDYLFIDAPPSLGLLTTSILLAVTEIIIPVSLTFLALDGCAEIIDTINIVRNNFKKSDLNIKLVVPTLYRKTKLADSILEKLKNHFNDKLSETVIGYNVKIDEAQSYGKVIWDYAPESTGAKILEKLANEINTL